MSFNIQKGASCTELQFGNDQETPDSHELSYMVSTQVFHGNASYRLSSIDSPKNAF